MVAVAAEVAGAGVGAEGFAAESGTVLLEEEIGGEDGEAFFRPERTCAREEGAGDDDVVEGLPVALVAISAPGGAEEVVAGVVEGGVEKGGAGGIPGAEGLLGGAVGFALAFHNPLAGLANSFAANIFTSAKRNKEEWKSVISSLITLVVTYFLYSGLRYLAYSNEFFRWYQCFLFNDYSFDLSLIPLGALSSSWAFCFVFFFSLPIAYIYVKSASIGRKLGWKDKASSYRFSLYVGVAICFVLFLFMPKALGTGSAYIDGIEGILAQSSSWILCLLLVRYVFTIFSFSSHYSGGTIIPTIGIGMLFGAFIASLSPSSFGGYEILFICSFALSFFGFVTENGLLPLALVFSLGFCFPLLIILIPSAALTILLRRYLSNLPVLSKGLAEADEANGALKESMFSLFPLCKWQEGLCLGNRTQWRDL